MTKKEAIKAMIAGHKVTHRYFSSNEWMTLTHKKIVLEDGVRCHPDEFWKWRTDQSWEDGYELFTESV